jgi:hypothetical protein
MLLNSQKPTELRSINGTVFLTFLSHPLSAQSSLHNHISKKSNLQNNLSTINMQFTISTIIIALATSVIAAPNPTTESGLTKRVTYILLPSSSPPLHYHKLTPTQPRRSRHRLHPRRWNRILRANQPRLGYHRRPLQLLDGQRVSRSLLRAQSTSHQCRI